MPKKINTDGGDGLSQNPFAGLDGQDLPEQKQPPPPASAIPTPKKKKSRGRLKMRREKAGRGGKTVTTIAGFETISHPERKELLLSLKKSCACGGALKDSTIELQGDVRPQATVFLEKEAFTVVQAGG